MTPPALPALRLVTTAQGARPPKPPLGLRAFTEAPDAALAVLLDLEDGPPARAQVDLVAAQLPAPEDLPEGRVVLVLGERAAGASLLGRLLRRDVGIPRAVRSTALLARGYVELGAGTDATGRELVWGKAAPRA
jgi:hypothetical protein